ncbi:MAG: carboxynorspermidine decarboxylase [Candidatus Latescibacteria bacterium]|nr:carboxynorspermidine decarboxylase [Candidatus Latescibacterota bacterium]
MIDVNTIIQQSIPSPCYLVDERALRENLEILSDIRLRTGAKILLALKGFAMFSLFHVIREYLDGTCASGLYEARLGRENFGKEVHVFSPAYSEDEFDELLTISNHIVFNSFSQWERFKSHLTQKPSNLRFGLRVNPEHSEADVELYDPCAPRSRLGIRRRDFEGKSIDGISGLHFHVLCEHNADALRRTISAFVDKFGEFLPFLEWVNFGGGHHITRPDYDRNLLCNILSKFKETYHVDIYLEPGEAVVLNAGILVATVQDIVYNEIDIAILDISATCHMPDVLEMPYRPKVEGGGLPGEKRFLYRLAGLSCLAGDVVGDYSFDTALKIGDKLVFYDMAHYTMVKTTMFNGVKHPAIIIWNPVEGRIKVVREFTYEDYKNRLS